MKKKWIVIIIIMMILTADAVIVYVLFGPGSLFVTKYTVEAGQEVAPQDLLRNELEEGETVCYTEDSPSIDTSVPGTYYPKVLFGNFTHTCEVTVVDTVTPKAESNPVYIMPGESCEASEMIQNIQDETAVTVSFETIPDFNSTGHEEVKLVLEDLGGNKAVIYSDLYVSKVSLDEPYEWEAGMGAPKLEDYLLENGEITLGTRGYRFVNFNKLGDYPVDLIIDGDPYQVTLRIVDNTSPVVTGKPVSGFLGHEVEASEFADSIVDVTEVVFSYVTPVDYTKEGVQEVSIRATDAGGNNSDFTAQLTLEQDIEAPVILGAGNISVEIGENVSYRTGISAIDNCDGEVPYSVDNSAVDLNTIGSYDVIYAATDSSGNETSITIRLTVMPQREGTYDINEVYDLANEVLSQIITDDMSQYDKAWAIYTWTKGKISFIDSSEKEDWVESAYNGFTYHKGDCYTYASVAKALLTCAGIPNVDVQRKSILSHHYWNLVDVGDGWYHFDATPRADKQTVFMMSESELQANEPIRRSHVYDKTLYPTVNEF